MPRKEIPDYKKVVIMAMVPFYGTKKVARVSDTSVYTVRKYRDRVKERGGTLDVDTRDDALVSPEGMKILDEIITDGMDPDEPGRI